MEALLRWQHPERGLVPPLQFIPLIEQTALVGPIAMYVIDSALEQLARWRDHGVHLTMSVNLSARNLLDPELPRRVGTLLARHAVPRAPPHRGGHRGRHDVRPRARRGGAG